MMAVGKWLFGYQVVCHSRLEANEKGKSQKFTFHASRQFFFPPAPACEAKRSSKPAVYIPNIACFLQRYNTCTTQAQMVTLEYLDDK